MEPQVVEVQEQTHSVGFPSQESKPSRKGGSAKWIIAIVGVVVIVIIGVVFILMSPGSGSTNPSPTPDSNSLKTLPTNSPSPTPAATSTPAPVDRADVVIEVLNGTGKAGEAGFLKGKLEDLGYKDISAGNADDQEQTKTTVVFSTDLPQTNIDEVTDLLKKLYEDVTVRKQSLSDSDIRITTGTRTQSAAASSTPTSSPTASPTATPEQ